MKLNTNLLLILLFLTIIVFLIDPFSFDYATSVVPGWHITIFPPYFIAGIIVTITLIIDCFIFIKVTKINSINLRKIVIAHFTINTVIGIFLKYPKIYGHYINTNNQVNDTIQITENIKYAVWSFIIIQIIYYFYIMKMLFKK